MKSILLSFFSFLFLTSLHAQVNYFPPLQGDQWETVSFAELGWCDDQLDELLDYLEISNTKAFIVLKDGKIVIEEYFGDTNMNTNLPWNSAGKTLTGLMIGVAQENGILSIDDKTSDYLGTGWTSLTSEEEDQILIQHQLAMTTGLDDTEAYCVTPECLTYLADPGTRWAYHNGPYTLLQDVIESASGITMNNYLNQNLKSKTGIQGAFIPLGTNKVFFGPARGMARMGLLALNEASWDTTAILSDMDYYNQMISPSQDLNLAYGYLWWLNGSSSFMLPSSQIVFPGSISIEAPADLFAGIGKNGQFMDVVPSQDLVVIRMGDAPNNDLVPLPFHNEMWEYLTAIICESTATEESIPSSSINIYPNPFNQQFQIDTDLEIATIQLYNAMGQLVVQQAQAGSISGRDLAVGIYWLEIIDTEGRKAVKQIVKQ